MEVSEHNRNPSQTPRIKNNNDNKVTLPAMTIQKEGGGVFSRPELAFSSEFVEYNVY